MWDDELGRERCTADSRQQGRRCRNRPRPGARVCRMHGGKAPQVERAAELRLAELVAPSITALGEIVEGPGLEWTVVGHGEHRTVKPVGFSANDKRKAAEAILDRAGYPKRTEVDLDVGSRRLLERIRELRAAREETP